MEGILRTNERRPPCGGRRARTLLGSGPGSGLAAATSAATLATLATLSTLTTLTTLVSASPFMTDNCEDFTTAQCCYPNVKWEIREFHLSTHFLAV